MSVSRAKGTRYEVEVRDYLQQYFPQIERAPFSSPLGDFLGIPFVLEAKNQKATTLSTWVDQSERSGERARPPYAIVHKRPRKNIAKSYVTLPLDQLVPVARAIAAELDRLEKESQ
jgi:hypothetical protein